MDILSLVDDYLQFNIYKTKEAPNMSASSKTPQLSSLLR